MLVFVRVSVVRLDRVVNYMISYVSRVFLILLSKFYLLVFREKESEIDEFKWIFEKFGKEGVIILIVIDKIYFF